MAKHTFKLKDRDGKEHVYETTAFRPTQGSSLRARIAAVVAEPILIGLYELRRGADGDPGKVALALRSALQSLPPDLIPAILEHTFRDGQMLAAEDNFNAAYERNYGELDRAIWEVVQYNDFLLLPGISLTETKA